MQKAVAALKGKFEQVRERPADVARELKTQTIDLIKYETRTLTPTLTPTPTLTLTSALTRTLTLT